MLSVTHFNRFNQIIPLTTVRAPLFVLVYGHLTTVRFPLLLEGGHLTTVRFPLLEWGLLTTVRAPVLLVYGHQTTVRVYRSLQLIFVL